MNDLQAGKVSSTFEFGFEPYVPLYEVEYQAILDRATALGITAPSEACKALQNQLVIALKAANAWNKYDIGYILANDSPDPEFATINWITPTQFKCTRVNNPTYTIKKGFNARATVGPGYLNTGWNVLNNAVKFNRSTGASVWSYSDDNISAGSMIDYGVGQATSQRVTLQSSLADGSKQFSLVSSIGTGATLDAISKGLWLNRRTTSNLANHSLWRDGVLFAAAGVTSSSAHPNANLCICCLNTTDTTFNNGSLRNQGMLFTGDGQVGLETIIPTIWYNYFNALQLL